MVPTAKEILLPGQNYYFPEQSIQDLKVINQDICKTYIYSLYDQIFPFCGKPASHPL